MTQQEQCNNASATQKDGEGDALDEEEGVLDEERGAHVEEGMHRKLVEEKIILYIVNRF